MISKGQKYRYNSANPNSQNNGKIFKVLRIGTKKISLKKETPQGLSQEFQLFKTDFEKAIQANYYTKID